MVRAGSHELVKNKCAIKKNKLIFTLLLLVAVGLQAQNDTMPPPPGGGMDTMTMLGTYYADRFVGRKTAAGDIFRQNQFTAAHKSIPFGTYLKVLNPFTGLEIVVRVNDRCPVKNVLDMTKIGVLKLGIKGSRKVKVVVLEPEEGYALWVQQDTLDMTYEEYMSYKDRSPVRRMTPYASNQAPQKTAPRSQPPAAQEAPAEETQPEAPPPPEETFVEDEAVVHVQAPVAEPVASNPAPAVEPPPKGPKFNLELCITGSRQAALRAAARLPRNLQGLVEYETIAVTRQVRVVLRLEDTRSHVVRTQSMLIDAFPDSNLIPVSND